jgi:hypothetical protein
VVERPRGEGRASQSCGLSVHSANFSSAPRLISQSQRSSDEFVGGIARNADAQRPSASWVQDLELERDIRIGPGAGEPRRSASSQRREAAPLQD